MTFFFPAGIHFLNVDVLIGDCLSKIFHSLLDHSADVPARRKLTQVLLPIQTVMPMQLAQRPLSWNYHSTDVSVLCWDILLYEFLGTFLVIVPETEDPVEILVGMLLLPQEVDSIQLLHLFIVRLPSFHY